MSKISRLEQHSGFGFLIFYIIYIIWTGSLILDQYLVLLIIFFSIFPDLDAIYWYIKQKSDFQLDETFQHHFHSVMHYPLLYLPIFIPFVIALTINFYPLYFLAPIIGIYCGHFFLDTFSCGDGIMWGKNPLRKGRYAKFINLYCKKTDGYHGLYWGLRYRKTITSRIGDISAISAIIIIQIFRFENRINAFPNNPGLGIFYIGPVIYLLLMLYMGLRKYPDKWLEEPPNGRYKDYRIDLTYINGLSMKNRRKHLTKYADVLNNSEKT